MNMVFAKFFPVWEKLAGALRHNLRLLVDLYPWLSDPVSEPNPSPNSYVQFAALLLPGNRADLFFPAPTLLEVFLRSIQTAKTQAPLKISKCPLEYLRTGQDN